jgi:hypothetical protein
MAGMAPAFKLAAIATGAIADRPKNASCLSCGNQAIWFSDKTLSDGTLALANLISVAARSPGTGKVLRKHGIRAMLRAS